MTKYASSAPSVRSSSTPRNVRSRAIASALAFADDAAREQAAKFNATLQIGYFLLGVRAAGLAAGPMGGFDAQGLDEEFFAGRNLKSLLVVNLGKPAENAWFDRLPRLDHAEVVLDA